MNDGSANPGLVSSPPAAAPRKLGPPPGPKKYIAGGPKKALQPVPTNGTPNGASPNSQGKAPAVPPRTGKVGLKQPASRPSNANLTSGNNSLDGGNEAGMSNSYNPSSSNQTASSSASSEISDMSASYPNPISYQSNGSSEIIPTSTSPVGSAKLPAGTGTYKNIDDIDPTLTSKVSRVTLDPTISIRKGPSVLTMNPSSPSDTDYPTPANATKRLDAAFSDPLFTKIEISLNSRRDNAAYELLTTEQSYCRSLTIMNELYRLPMLEACKRGLLPVSEETVHDIFSRYFTDIAQVNFVLLQGLVNRFSNWNDQQTLGDELISLLPFLKMYTQYTSNYDRATTALGEIESKEAVKAFFDECFQNPHRTVDIRAYLIMPIQRIPRYRLLLEEILKSTPDNHADKAPLEKALEKIKSVAIQIDAAIYEHENRAKLLEIQESFFGEKVQIIEAGRTFLKEGELQKICRKDVQKRAFWLFNDILIYAKQLPSSSKYSKHRTFPLKAFSVKDIPDDGKLYLNAIQIATEKKSFVVLCNTAEEKGSWMATLTSALEKVDEQNSSFMSHGNTGRTRQTATAAPVWVPDSVAIHCTICGLKFTLFERRHHCRQCGQVVCSKCSSKKKELPGQGKKRVCDVCYKKPYPDGSTPSNISSSPVLSPSITLTSTTTPVVSPASLIVGPANTNTSVSSGNGQTNSTPMQRSPSAGVINRNEISPNTSSNTSPANNQSAAQTAPRPPGEKFRAAYDFDAPVPESKPRKISFKAGDILEITQKAETGWWFAILGDQRGWVPASFLEPVS